MARSTMTVADVKAELLQNEVNHSRSDRTLNPRYQERRLANLGVPSRAMVDEEGETSTGNRPETVTDNKPASGRKPKKPDNETQDEAPVEGYNKLSVEEVLGLVDSEETRVKFLEYETAHKNRVTLVQALVNWNG